MKPIYADPKGGKYEIFFTNDDDISVVDPKVFGLPKIHYGKFEEIHNHVVAAELFLNWYRFDYRVPDFRVKVKLDQPELGLEAIWNILYHGSFAKLTDYWHGSHKRQRRIKKKVAIFKQNGDIGEEWVSTGLYAEEKYKTDLRLAVGNSEATVVVRGYSTTTQGISARVVSHIASRQWPASVTDGGGRWDFFTPFENAPELTHDGEPYPFQGFHIPMPEEEIETIWNRSKEHWLAIAEVLHGFSLRFDISRKDIVSAVLQRTEEEDIPQLVEYFQKTWASMAFEVCGMQHAKKTHRLLTKSLGDFRAQQYVPFEEWIEPFRRVSAKTDGLLRTCLMAYVMPAKMRSSDDMYEDKLPMFSLTKRPKKVQVRPGVYIDEGVETVRTWTKYYQAYIDAWKKYSFFVQQKFGAIRQEQDAEPQPEEQQEFVWFGKQIEAPKEVVRNPLPPVAPKKKKPETAIRPAMARSRFKPGFYQLSPTGIWWDNKGKVPARIIIWARHESDIDRKKEYLHEEYHYNHFEVIVVEVPNFGGKRRFIRSKTSAPVWGKKLPKRIKPKAFAPMIIGTAPELDQEQEEGEEA